MTEALGDERGRAEALREQLRAIVLDLEGPAIDEAAFTAMAPEDVEIVRGTLQGGSAVELEGLEAEWLDFIGDSEGGEGWQEPQVAREELEGEIGRIEAEIAESERRQEAFSRYLEALGE